MITYYLFLKVNPQEKPTIIKKCQAKNSLEAAIIFTARLNNFNKGTLFSMDELTPSIKSESDLSLEEQQWIEKEEIDLLEL